MEITIKVTVDVNAANRKEIEAQVNDKIKELLADPNYMREQVREQSGELVQVVLEEFFHNFDMDEYSDQMADIEGGETLYDMIKPLIKEWMENRSEKYKKSIYKKIESGIDEVLTEVLSR